MKLDASSRTSLFMREYTRQYVSSQHFCGVPYLSKAVGSMLQYAATLTILALLASALKLALEFLSIDLSSNLAITLTFSIAAIIATTPFVGYVVFRTLNVPMMVLYLCCLVMIVFYECILCGIFIFMALRLCVGPASYSWAELPPDGGGIGTALGTVVVGIVEIVIYICLIVLSRKLFTCRRTEHEAMRTFIYTGPSHVGIYRRFDPLSQQPLPPPSAGVGFIVE